jgi:hypothetical protein
MHQSNVLSSTHSSGCLHHQHSLLARDVSSRRNTSCYHKRVHSNTGNKQVPQRNHPTMEHTPQRNHPTMGHTPQTNRITIMNGVYSQLLVCHPEDDPMNNKYPV